MKLLGQKTWTPGTCLGQVGPRSYDVKVGESTYRRNRRQLISAGEPPIPDISDQPEPDPVSPENDTTPRHLQAEPQTQAPSITAAQPVQPNLRRSQRHRKPPERYGYHVPK